MPSDDLILNVRQIAQYTPTSSAPTSASILMQTAGIGSAYASISPADLVGTALSSGGGMAIGGLLQVGQVQGGSAQFSNGAFGILNAQKSCFRELEAAWATLNGLPIATQAYVDGSVGALRAATVWSFNGRVGAVNLWIQDILKAGGAPIYSPRFQGQPAAWTPPPNSNSSRLATTAFVHGLIPAYIDDFLKTQPLVFTFNGRSGDIVLTADDIIAAGGSGEIFDSPAFTGIPTAPTAPPGTNTTQIATTQFVMTAIAGGPFAPINSPVFTGVPQGPTAPPGSSTGQLATTAFVMNAVAASTAGVASFNTRTGAVVFEASDITGVGGALLASPAFSGNPTAPTPPPGDNDTSIATTAFVATAVAAVAGGVTSFNTRTGAIILTSADVTSAGGALLASPVFSGTPTAPTAAFGNSSQQLATTAFVAAAILNGAVESFNGRVGNVTLTSADISAAGGAALQSPAFTGTPTAPTAAPGANTNQLATTAFVTAAIGVGAGVTSFNTRTGAVVLNLADVTGVGGAPLNSPNFTGVPSGPTAAPGVSSTQLATTAFVAAALAGGVGVSSFNTRTGAVTLLGSDITAAGGAVLNSPAFTGSPTAPTATAGNSSQAIATTAFVQAAITAGSVASFNGRVGAITLNSADVSAAGGALLASPTFTGTPHAPTPTVGDNSTLIATTAFVDTALAAAGGVNSFNGRAGAVTLIAADITGAGGALLASPAFTGTPTAPTATAGTSTTQLATTAYVTAAIASLGTGPFLPLAGGNITGGLNVNSNLAVVGNISWGNCVSAPANFGGQIAANAGGVALRVANISNFGTLNNLSPTGSAVVTIENPNGLALACMSSAQAATSGMMVRSDRLDGNAIVFYFGQSSVAGRITINSATTVQYLTSSDYRLKIDHGLANPEVGAIIDAVPVHDAEFKTVLPRGVRMVVGQSSGQTRYPMFIAHELQAVCPWAVNGEKDALTPEGDIAPQGVDASKVVALLWAEIQNLRGRMAALEAA